MSNDNLVQDERDLNLADLAIGQLRGLAKMYGIASQRDWKKEDYVREIKIAQGDSIPNAVHLPAEPVVEKKPEPTNYTYAGMNSPSSNQKPLAAGHARIIIHKDPVPGNSNSAIPLGLNGKVFIAPRGVEFDIPKEYIGVLNDSKVTVIRQKSEPSAANPAGEVVEEDIYSYPFQVLAVAPGEAFRSDQDQRGSLARRKAAFHAVVHKWPTVGELLEFEKEQRLVLRSDK